MPPATAGPSTAAITGFDSSSRDGPSGPRGALPPPLGKSRLPTGLFWSRLETDLRSQPAQKAPPSPQNTATLALASASNCSKAATRSSALLASMALRASGRLWMTVQTPPDFSMRTLMSPPDTVSVSPAGAREPSHKASGTQQYPRGPGSGYLRCARDAAKPAKTVVRKYVARLPSRAQAAQGGNMARITDCMTPAATLPRDGTAGALVGRVWLPKVEGPAVAAVRGDGVYDISRLASTVRDLAEMPDAAGIVRAGQGRAHRCAGRAAGQYAGSRPRCRQALAAGADRPAGDQGRGRHVSAFHAGARDRGAGARGTREGRDHPRGASPPRLAATSPSWCRAARRRPSSSAC